MTDQEDLQIGPQVGRLTVNTAMMSGPNHTIYLVNIGRIDSKGRL